VQKWNKRSSNKKAAETDGGKDIRQDRQEDLGAGAPAALMTFCPINKNGKMVEIDWCTGTSESEG
jgi:hypothetical protein